VYDFSKQITKFHNEHITLTQAQRTEMRDRRNTNRKRIIDGLAEAEKPSPSEWINQGGYAQRTMTQPPEGDEESRYDIDMGVVFDYDDALTPLTTKGWVRDAIASKASNMKYDPECKPKCVRVVYAAGYQCDFPVFRVNEYGTGYDLASGSEWIDSDPAAMNEWIDEEVIALSLETAEPRQLRMVIRAIKYFGKVRAFKSSAKHPSGLVATALAIECYQSRPGRLDEAIRETLRQISLRSECSSVIANGVVISDNKDTPRIKRLIDAASNAITHLDELDDAGCDDEMAGRLWKKVFHHSYFDTFKVEKKSAEWSGSLAETAAALASITQAEQLARARAAAARLTEAGLASKPWGSTRED
jgi:hypothetical protein